MIKYFYFWLLSTLGFFYGLYIGYKNKILFHGPDSNEIRKIIYKKKHNKCYRLKPKIVSC